MCGQGYTLAFKDESFKFIIYSRYSATDVTKYLEIPLKT